MRRELADADRRLALRQAARAWERAGAIDAQAARAVEAEFPDDRVRYRPALAVLFFVLTAIGASAAVGFVAVLLDLDDDFAGQALFVAAGIACAWLAERLLGRGRHASTGIDLGLSTMAALFTWIGMSWLLFDSLHVGLSNTSSVLLPGLLACFGAAAWRWGSWLHALVATVAALLLLVATPSPRLAWLLAALVLAEPLARASESLAVAPRHRHCALASLGALLVAAYFAVHLGSRDASLLESVARELFGHRDLAPLPRGLALAGTVGVPAAVLAWGLLTRRRLALGLGVLMAGVSVGTLRFYWEAGPPWLWLVAGGAAVMGVALLLRRWLDAGAERERFGYTAEPLFDDPRRASAIEAAAAMATLTPSSGPAPTAESGFEGGGGRSGGAGATGEY